jgi:hypothetical protein
MFGAVLAGSMGQERPASRPHVSLSASRADSRERSDTVTSVTDKSRQQQRALSEERSTYVCALCYANGRTTGRHAYSTLMSFLIYSRRKRCHGSRDKVQSEVYDVVTDGRPRLVAPHPRETRPTPSSRITSSARVLSHRLLKLIWISV